MIEHMEGRYYSHAWVGSHAEGTDFFGMLYKDAGSVTWVFQYRFKYPNGVKNWYRASADKREEQVMALCRIVERTCAENGFVMKTIPLESADTRVVYEKLKASGMTSSESLLN